MELTLIDFYRAIEDSSGSSWTCAVLIEQLRLKAHDEPLAPEQRKEKARIMQRILRNDAQIRTLAEPWLAQFEHMFDGQPHAMH
jgi:flagellar protein FliT